jgi:teichuronic acid biosynthesis glycosyltransferase TuaC
MLPENAEKIAAGDTLKILTFTTLYPNSVQPNHGIFVENRLIHLLATQRVMARVLAPVPWPWFPSTAQHFGRRADGGPTPAREIRNGVEIDHPRYLLVPKFGVSMAPTLLYVASLAFLRNRPNDFDLIDAHYFYPDGVAAILLGRALKKPVVITARGTDINLLPNYGFPRRQIQFAARHAAALIAVSQALKDALVGLGVPAERITVLRNGVDLTLFRPADREAIRAKLQVHGRTLLSVGHLIERKGHDITISALAQLPDYTLLIAGEGPERTRLERLADKLGIRDRVKFLGLVPHENLPDYYTAADALVLASSREGWPNVLLEAMACGTPVVASTVWGNPEVVSARAAGVLMRSRTPQGVAEAVNLLFHDLPARAATRAFAEAHSWEETSAGQLRLFEQILAQPLPSMERNR